MISVVSSPRLNNLPQRVFQGIAIFPHKSKTSHNTNTRDEFKIIEIYNVKRDLCDFMKNVHLNTQRYDSVNRKCKKIGLTSKKLD